MDFSLISNEKELLSFVNASNIYEIEQKLKLLPQAECPVDHEFAEGQYIRTMHIPANTLVIGKMHRHSTFNVFLKGCCTIFAGEGFPTQFMEAPTTFVSAPMVKKMAFFHEDSIWINTHPTEETDLDKIEEIFIVPEEEVFISIEGGAKCLGEQ